MKALALSVALLGCIGVISWAVYSGINTRAEQMGKVVGKPGGGFGGGINGPNRAGKVRWDF